MANQKTTTASSLLISYIPGLVQYCYRATSENILLIIIYLILQY